jgi:hypothetical protein
MIRLIFLRLNLREWVCHACLALAQTLGFVAAVGAYKCICDVPTFSELVMFIYVRLMSSFKHPPLWSYHLYLCYSLCTADNQEYASHHRGVCTDPKQG